MEEIQEKFVTTVEPVPGRRAQIWSDFQRATSAIQSVTPVAAAWIGGSFVSSKAHPSDIDVVYLVRANEYDAITDAQQQSKLNIFKGEKRLMQKGLLVDSYVIDWRPRGTEKPTSHEENKAMAHRGYWDDWLQRKPAAGKPDDDPENALPRRGYLEVILDGYTA